MGCAIPPPQCSIDCRFPVLSSTRFAPTLCSRRRVTDTIVRRRPRWATNNPVFAIEALPKRREPMTVRTILSRKGSDVVTIAPIASLTEAVKLLGERRIGAVVVTGPDNRVAGILSERDIVRAIGERGHPALDENVGAVMTRKVVTCTETDTIAFIMERMTAGKFRHLPVVDQGRLTGVISIGDVVKFRVEEIEHETEALREYIATA